MYRFNYFFLTIQLILVLLQPLHGYADNDMVIYGYVLDESTGDSISGALVTFKIKKNSQMVELPNERPKTNAIGYFSFNTYKSNENNYVYITVIHKDYSDYKDVKNSQTLTDEAPFIIKIKSKNVKKTDSQNNGTPQNLKAKANNQQREINILQKQLDEKENKYRLLEQQVFGKDSEIQNLSRFIQQQRTKLKKLKDENDIILTNLNKKENENKDLKQIKKKLEENEKAINKKYTALKTLNKNLDDTIKIFEEFAHAYIAEQIIDFRAIPVFGGKGNTLHERWNNICVSIQTRDLNNEDSKIYDKGFFIEVVFKNLNNYVEEVMTVDKYSQDSTKMKFRLRESDYRPIIRVNKQVKNNLLSYRGYYEISLYYEAISIPLMSKSFPQPEKTPFDKKRHSSYCH